MRRGNQTGALDRPTGVLVISLGVVSAVAVVVIGWLLSGCALEVRRPEVRASARSSSADGASDSGRPGPTRDATPGHPAR